MNVTIFTGSDFPNGKAAENFVRQMALGLHECGEKINIVRFRGKTYPGENDTNIKCNNLLFPQRPKNEILKFFELITLILYSPLAVIYYKIRFRSDVVLIYGIDYSYFTIPISLFSKLLGIKIYRIITDHYDFDTIVPVWWKKPKAYCYKHQLERIDKRFDGLIVLSRYLKESAIANGVDCNRILLVPHFIDVQSFSDEVVDEKEDNETRQYIGFCGNPSLSNGIIDLVKAFISIKQIKKYENVGLIIIGSVKQSIMKEIESRCGESIINSISFTGFLNKSMVNVMLNKCNILVNPRKSGRKAEAGFPTKLGEYFATKKPVIATRLGDLNYYFKDKNELVFADADNPDSLAKSMILLLDNQELARKIGYEGYAWARENLDYKINAIRLLKFLKR
jgi:glycosyltransferase involved in cell wall biosynthesis